MNVTIAGIAYECTKAVKGPDFVRLYQDDMVILSCLGVSDFSDYILTDGEWSDPDPDLDVIADSAEVDEGFLVITAKGIIGTGTLLKFQAPCGCESVTEGLVINGETYDLYDSAGNHVLGVYGMWVSEALISVLIDKVNYRAFIQNGAKPACVLGIEDGGTGATTADEARDKLDAAPKTHTHAMSDVYGTLPVSKGGTGATAVEKARENLGAAATVTINVSVGTSWSASSTNGFSQTCSASGMKAGDNPIVDLILGSDIEANALYKEAWACVDRIVTADNSVTIYANKDCPTTAFSFQAKVVR